MHNQGGGQNVAAKLQAAKQKHLAGNVLEAEEGYRALLKRYPKLTEVLHPLGIALQQQGRHAEAVEFIERWVTVAPKDYDALINLGTSLLNVGRGSDAAAAFEKAAQLRPAAAENYLLAGMGHQASGDMAKAEQSYRQLLAKRPDSPECLYSLGYLLCNTGRVDEGMLAYREALKYRPTMVEAMVNLASHLQGRGQVEEARSLYKEVLRLKPGMPEALLNLATLDYEMGGDPVEAVGLFRQVLEKLPDNVDALNNLANIHIGLGQMDEAEATVRRLMARHPQSSTGHGTAAALFMLTGQWEEGWQHLEWRWLRDDLPVPLRDFGKPEWRGEDISTKTILLHHEQGLGDSIQFVRFAALVAARAGQVILEVPGNLMDLYSCIPGVTLVAYDKPLPPFDVQLPLMSVPFVLGVTVDHVPASVPYLSPDPARVEAWRSRVPQEGFRIGIVWQGKPGTSVDRGRSYLLNHLAPIARVPGVTLVSLQKGHGLQQLDDLPDGMRVETLGPDFDEGGGAFLDTVAVMQHMDLIISSDTSVAHLAGALGRPVWVPLKLSPDWRWMVEREDCPWYPTMRLFRQTRAGEWANVFQRLAGDVAALKDGDRSQLLPPPPPERKPAAPFPPVPAPPLPRMRPPVKLEQPAAPAPVPGEGGKKQRSYFPYSRDVGGGIMETETLFGRMRYPANDGLIGNCLGLYGEWGADEAELCTSFLAEGDVVVEAGGNIGSLTLPLARAVGTSGLVHTFEPQRLLNGLLAWNLQANMLDQVRVHHAAVGDEAGEILVPPVDYGEMTNFGGLTLIGASEGDKVPLVTIDSLGLEKLRLLKADVEGMEAAVVRGARETIMRCRPVMYVECANKAQADELIPMIEEMGYRVWWHASHLYREGNFRGNKNNLFTHTASFNLLAIPAENRPVVMGLQLSRNPPDLH